MRFSLATRRRPRRGLLVLASVALGAVSVCALAAFRPQASFPERLERYLQDWYATIPGTSIVVRPSREVTIRGYPAWRLERKAESGTAGTAATAARAESGLALTDEAGTEVFLGEVLHDPDRFAAKRPFDAGADLPAVQASLQQMLGVAVRIEKAPPSVSADREHPGLAPLAIRARQDEEAWTSMPGFVSTDGATVLLGEFRSLSEPIAAWRRKLLAARPGIRTEAGSYVVTEFLDFQCERCKRRTPEARRAASSLGGTVEARFLPLVKQHEWAFAAAECAAALAETGPEGPDRYRRYEESVFARSEGMTATAARELARDVADAASVRSAYDAALSSGRARDRVLQDVELASRLGIHGTPSFVLDGKLVPGERGYLENALFLAHGKGKKGESGDRVIG